ncbi:MAG: CpsD/CapB family tyrosine-protein kinase [Bryobacterales bacterium]|nr:CpsD/CapB family tyrosine-protein kinase [Bryobacterales bacterium]
MSRIYDALRRAEQGGEGGERPRRPPVRIIPGLEDLLSAAPEIPYTPAPDFFVIDPTRSRDAHSEEFRTLRTRLNHLQKLQPLHSVVLTSPCPAEGKSFTVVNLALAEAQLTDNPTLLADFDFRRPVLHNIFQIERTPGATDFLAGQAGLADVVRRIAGTNLYLMTAGTAVSNPLEMLNLTETRTLLEQLPSIFNWVLLDSPPLLFAADANLLATMTDGTVLVVRIGVTTIDSVTRAMQSLCENNVLGIVANGARAGELYSKYTYYYSSYYYKDKREWRAEEEEEER